MQTQKVENIQSNVVQLDTVKKSKQVPKLRTDGSEKQTPNNNSEKRWVHPIRNKEDVIRCIEYLHQKALTTNRIDTQKSAYRDWLLFVIGVNVGLRVSDLITLKWNDIFESDMITFLNGENVKEKKTGKMKLVCPNKYMQDVIKEYLICAGVTPVSGGYIFTSGRKSKDGEYHAISDAAVEKMIKEVAEACGLVGNYNTHSLRKSFAYHKYMMLEGKGDPLALVKVQKSLNHRNSSDTARYLGITRDDEIKSNMELGEYWDL